MQGIKEQRKSFSALLFQDWNSHMIIFSGTVSPAAFYKPGTTVYFFSLQGTKGQGKSLSALLFQN